MDDNLTESVVVAGRLPAADPVPDQHGPGWSRPERECGGEDSQRLQHHGPPAPVSWPGRPTEADGQPAAQCGPAGTAAAAAATANSDNLQQPNTEQLGLLEKRRETD